MNAPLSKEDNDATSRLAGTAADLRGDRADPPRADDRKYPGPDPLIPFPLTEVDERINTAHARGVQTGTRQYVYLYGEKVWITGTRPASFACIAVDPTGWAIWLAPGADESELG